MISLDCETSGLDLHHGALPFFITTCNEQGEQTYWCWDVDPLTRKVAIPPEDVEVITHLIGSHHKPMPPFIGSKPIELGPVIVGQNFKFDAHCLAAIGVPRINWTRVNDTLIASHVLASNQPHDLTSLVLHYLGKDLKPFETALEECVKECRSKVQQARLKEGRARAKGKSDLFGSDDPLTMWAIADEGRPDMPSATKETWRFDYWLPRAMARHLSLPPDNRYWRVLRDYGNADSAATLALWPVLKAELERRGLWGYYRERMKLPPALWEMERRGVTLNRTRLVELRKHYQIESAAAAETCVAIARKHEYDLQLPAGPRNKSLTDFCFDVLKLPAYEYGKTGPALNAATRQRWETEIEGDGKEFVQALGYKAKKDTHISYLEGYERYAIRNRTSGQETGGPLHQSAGRTGGEPPRHTGGGGGHLELTTDGGIGLGRGSEATSAGIGMAAGAGCDWLLLHPSINQTGTATTRFSSSNPNSQNISTKEDDEGISPRNVFGPMPRREWWSLDATNIELRIPTYETGETEMIAVFEAPDKPPYFGSVHLLNFSTVLPDLWNEGIKMVGLEKVGEWCKTTHKGWYKKVKGQGFSIQYGATDVDGGTADRALGVIGSQRKIRDRFRRIHGPGGLNERQCRFADEMGYVETIPDKAVDPKHGYPLMVTRTEWGKVLPTVPLSYHVQGTAGYWMGVALTLCCEKLREWRGKGFDAWCVLTVHDQCVFDMPAGTGPGPWKTNLGKVKILKALMESVGDRIGIPTPVEVTYHATNWGEGKVINV